MQACMPCCAAYAVISADGRTSCICLQASGLDMIRYTSSHPQLQQLACMPGCTRAAHSATACCSRRRARPLVLPAPGPLPHHCGHREAERATHGAGGPAQYRTVQPTAAGPWGAQWGTGRGAAAAAGLATVCQARRTHADPTGIPAAVRGAGAGHEF